MRLAAFQSGQRVDITGKSYRLYQLFGDTWQLTELSSNRAVQMPHEVLQEQYRTGKLRFVHSDAPLRELSASPSKSHREVPEAAWELAKIRRAYVMAVLGLPSTKSLVAPVIHATWLRLKQPTVTPPCAASVLRWKKLYIEAGDNIHVLIDRTEKKGNRNARYDQAVIDIVETAIDSTYLQRERKTLQDVVDKAAARILKENMLRPSELPLPLPSRRLVKRMIQAIPAYDRHVARYGRDEANQHFRHVKGHRTTEAPLERAEIDHTKLDLYVIDDITGHILGRPWLTACIDDFSRCILGIEISFEPPSNLTVANCLKHAFMPKNGLRTTYPSIENEWHAHGVMRELVVDNGLEFHGTSLEQVCLELGIDIHFSPRKTPMSKGKIERFFQTLEKGVAHGNPGTTFSNIMEKGDYNPLEHARISLSTLREVIHKWIVDVYHAKPHRTLQASPAEVWTQHIDIEDIRLPSDLAEIDTTIGRVAKRVLRHSGIELDGLHYNSEALRNLRHELGTSLSVEIRINESDLGKIIVFSPDKKRKFVAYALHFDYADGLSKWQHGVNKRHAKEVLLQPNIQGWVLAKESIRERIEESLTRPKAATAAKAARYKNLNVQIKGDPMARHHQAPASASTEDVVAIASPTVAEKTNESAASYTAAQARVPRFVPVMTKREQRGDERRNAVQDKDQESKDEH